MVSNSKQESKYFSEGYVGVKYTPIQLSLKLPEGASKYFSVFKRVCDRLKQCGMTPGNSGNMSISVANGFLITSTGSNLGLLDEDEIVFAESCDLEEKKVSYRGPQIPSSESMMHWLIYHEIPRTRAILHAHDEFATRPEILKGEVEESEYEMPYGTIESAQAAIDTFRRAKDIIVLKNHGYVAIGQDLDSVCDLVLGTHNRLLTKKENL